MPQIIFNAFEGVTMPWLGARSQRLSTVPAGPGTGTAADEDGSVAGEEDPGAALDLPTTPAAVPPSPPLTPPAQAPVPLL